MLLRISQNRCRILVTSLSLLIGISTSPVVGQSLPKASAEKLQTPAEKKFDLAAFYLEKGTWYTIAIRELEFALELDPNHSEYELALGCAYAGRATALSEAASSLLAFKKDQQKYKKWMVAWETAQKDSANPLYQKPAPVPPVLKNRDDDKPFLLSEEQTRQQYLTLMQKATKIWKSAEDHSQTTQQKADAQFTQAWGLLLFRRFGTPLIPLEQLPELKPLQATFRQLTKTYPTRGKYWQALGDSLTQTGDFEVTGKTDPEIANAYDRAARFDPKNRMIYYRLYLMVRNASPELTRKALEKLCILDQDNAFAPYKLATLMLETSPYGDFYRIRAASFRDGFAQVEGGLKSGTLSQDDIKNGTGKENFSQKKFETDEEICERLKKQGVIEKADREVETALSYLEKGNSAKQLSMPAYLPTMPPFFAKMWLSTHRDDGEYVLLDWQSLTMTLEGYCKLKTIQKEGDKIIRVGQARLGFGLKRMGALDTSRLPLSAHEETEFMFSRFDLNVGYNEMIQGNRLAGRQEIIEQLRTESKTLLQRHREFERIRMEAAENFYTSSY